MKRKLKRLAVLCLSLVLTFCLALPVWAEPAQTYTITPDQTGSITVENVESGAKVDIYQLVTVQFDAGNQQPVEPMYTWVSGVAGWVRTNYPAYIGTGNDNSVTTAFSSTINETNSAAFYDALAAAIRGKSFGLTATQTADIGDSGSHTFTNLAMGNYLIIVEDSVKVYRPSAANLIPVWDEKANSWNMSDATVELKSSELSLIKTVFDKSTDLEPIDYEAGGSEQAQVAIGDTVTYMLVADVPSYPASATATGYQISDSLPSGMELNTNSIKVYGIDATTAHISAGTLLDNTSKTYYTKTANRPIAGNPAVSFNLDFDYDSIKIYSKIRVVYTATADESIEVIGQNTNSHGNQNTAYLDYNNNPYESSTAPGLSWETAQDTATVYTYGIDISKVDAADGSKPLPRAEFTLSKDGTTSNPPISFVGNPGSYRVALPSDTTTTTTLVADNNGKLKISGLDVGDYTLTETKAPAGYVKPSTPVTVIIADQQDGTPNGKPEYTPTDSGSSKEATDGYVPLTVKNHTGFTLPSTGGIGTVLFTTFGVVLMGGGFALLMVYLRRRNRAK